MSSSFRTGPGNHFIDDITTGAGQIKDASAPCLGNPQATIAGICGPGGFAAVKSVGAGDHNNLGPRLGFAWDMFGNGKTAVRGGFGIAYQSAIFRPYSNIRWNPPFYSLNGALNSLVGDTSNIVYGPIGGGTPTFLGPAPQAQRSGFGAQATGNISGWDPQIPILQASPVLFLPRASLIRRSKVTSWVFNAPYGVTSPLKQTMRHQRFTSDARRNVNRIPGGLLPEGTCVRDNLGRLLCSQRDRGLNQYGELNNPIGRLNPNFGVLRVWRDIAASDYNSLQVSLPGEAGRWAATFY